MIPQNAQKAQAAHCSFYAPRPFAQHAQQLLDAGLCPIPIVAGAKRPAINGWTEYAERPDRIAAELQSWFEAYPAAGVGVLCSNQLLAIDVDTDDAGIHAAVVQAFGATPTAKIGRIGATYFYRQPVGALPSTKVTFPKDRDGTTAHGVDILARGRQAVIPPSIHPDTGQPYRWVNEQCALGLVAFDQLPQAPHDALERLLGLLQPYGAKCDKVRARQPAGSPETAPSATRAPTPHVNAGGDGGPCRELNELALTRLAAWVPDLGLTRMEPTSDGYRAVADFRASSNGTPTDQRGLNLGVTPQGIRDWGADQGYTALDLVMTKQRVELSGAFSWLAERLGYEQDDGSDFQFRFDAPAENDDALIEIEEPEAAEVAEDPALAEFRRLYIDGDLVPIDEASIRSRMDGLLDIAVREVMASSAFPDFTGALVAALSLLSAVFGHRYTVNGGIHPTLYIAHIADSGVGKGEASITPLKSAAAFAPSLEQCLADSVTGDAALVKTLEIGGNRALIVADEVEAFFDRKGGRGATARANLAAVLRTLFSPQQNAKYVKRYAQSEVELHTPCLTLAMFSTPAQFFSVFPSAALEDGTLARILAFEAPLMDPRLIEPQTADLDAPRRLGAWLEKADTNAPMSASEAEMTPEATAKIQQLRQQSRIDTYLLARAGRDGGAADIPSGAAAVAKRVHEIALRIALINAAGRAAMSGYEEEPIVTLDDLNLGLELARLSARTVIRRSAEMVHDSEHEEIKARIEKALRDSEGKGATMTALRRRVPKRIEPRAFDAALKDLALRQQVCAGLLRKPGKGRPSVRFFAGSRPPAGFEREAI